MMPHFDIPAGHRKHAKRMRGKMTDAELRLWNELRAHRLMGLAFRRQMPIGGYIVDFACSEHKLIVEVDGSQHGDDSAVDYDTARTSLLEAMGWTVLRFWNHEVLTSIDGVCDAILRTIGLEKFQ